MGCDIHLHIEVKLKGGHWEHWGCPNIKRWYALFAKMAGVRTDEPEKAIALPKGLPADMTTLTRRDAEGWDVDGHSHSWLGVDEIIQLEQWLKEQPAEPGEWGCNLEHHILHSYLFGSGFTGWKRYPDDNRHGMEDVRFVFWFDN